MEGSTQAEDNDWSWGRLTVNKSHWQRLAGARAISCNQTMQSAEETSRHEVQSTAKFTKEDKSGRIVE